jgi:tRNA threonylcarbamoyladenosine biosynthesis protein TsaB
VIILTLRTDKPEAEIGLYDHGTMLTYETWQAHRELAETLHQKLDVLLKTQHKGWHDIQGIVAYQGPGSFTGLRIGLSVANALADSLKVPIVAAQTDDWVANGLQRLQNGEDDSVALPEYGAPVHITQQKR